MLNLRELDPFELRLVDIRERAMNGEDVRREIKIAIEESIADRNKKHLCFAEFTREYLGPKFQDKPRRVTT